MPSAHHFLLTPICLQELGNPQRLALEAMEMQGRECSGQLLIGELPPADGCTLSLARSNILLASVLRNLAVWSRVSDLWKLSIRFAVSGS